MSAATVVIIAESLVLAVVVLFVVALLRSHAEILRRLHGLESRAGAAAGSGPPAADPSVRGAAGPSVRGAADVVVGDLVGETLAGDAVKIALGGGAPRTLLAFLSSGCGACGPLWSALRDGAPVPRQARLVVVTKGPERESVTSLVELAPTQYELVMSTSAWEDLSVPSTPHFVLVDGDSGRIEGRGSAISWDQIVTLVEQAGADVALHASEPPSPGARDSAGRDSAARSSAERAARAQETLAAAGITAGHPSLYPSRGGAGGGEQP
ncbi:MAG: TlpA family protein disulfide reductase [Solirubrobacteraceae bacterium]